MKSMSEEEVLQESKEVIHFMNAYYPSNLFFKHYIKPLYQILINKISNNESITKEKKWSLREALDIYEYSKSDIEKYLLIENRELYRGLSMNPKIRALHNKHYRTHCAEVIFNNFGERCVCCSGLKKVYLTTFILSPNIGAKEFLIHKKSGYIINNLIPLCRACWIKKYSRTIVELLPLPRFIKLQATNATTSKKINFFYTSLP